MGQQPSGDPPRKAGQPCQQSLTTTALCVYTTEAVHRASQPAVQPAAWQVHETVVFLPMVKGSNIDRLRAELAAEFRDALLHAYHGPHVDMSARQLPTAFEADERTDTASPDILQLLSGRCATFRFIANDSDDGETLPACVCRCMPTLLVVLGVQQAAAGGRQGTQRQPSGRQQGLCCARA